MSHRKLVRSAALVLIGLLSLTQLANAQRRRRPSAQQPKPARPGLSRPADRSASNAKRGDLRIPTKVHVGDAAPDFTIKTLDGKETVTLSAFRGKKPVVLIFGSYT